MWPIFLERDPITRQWYRMNPKRKRLRLYPSMHGMAISRRIAKCTRALLRKLILVSLTEYFFKRLMVAQPQKMQTSPRYARGPFNKSKDYCYCVVEIP